MACSARPHARTFALFSGLFRNDRSSFGEGLHREGRGKKLTAAAAAAEVLAPEQLAVGVSGGISVLIHGIRLILEAWRTFVCVRLDMSNGYNACSRSVLLRRLSVQGRATVPCLTPDYHLRALSPHDARRTLYSLAARTSKLSPARDIEGTEQAAAMNVIKFPSAIFSVDDATAVDQQVLAAAAAGAEAHGSTFECGAPEPRAAAAAGVEPGGNSATPESDDSSSEGDDEPDPAPVSTGFKLNLGKVAANQVDDTKPVAMPHTPKGEVVQGLLAQQGSSGAASALPEDARGVSEGEESSEGDDEEPPPASTGFKIDLSRVGKSVVDDAKPVAVPHTPKGDVVQGILAKQRSIGAAVGTARPHC